MRTYDFSPLFRYSVGFDHVEDLLRSAVNRGDQASTYPPYNIESLGETSYRITMALAGFAEEDLDIIQRENSLVIEGRAKSRDDDVDFLHQGIANRAFKRSFELADHVKVTGANLENGLLTVDLERELPEALKPRKIEIAKGSPSSLVNKAKKLLSNEDQFAA